MFSVFACCLDLCSVAKAQDLKQAVQSLALYVIDAGFHSFLFCALSLTY